jgi:hypothetical protein
VIALVTEHLVFDGWSLRFLLDDLIRAYTGEKPSAPVDHSPAALALAARCPAADAERAERIARWSAMLGGRPLAPRFAPDWPGGDGHTRLVTWAIDLSADSGALARRRAAGLQVSLHSYLLAATLSWLSALSRGPDCGLVVSYHGRQTAAEREVVGNFANVMSLRVEPDAYSDPERLISAAALAMQAAQTNFVPYSVLRAVLASDDPSHDFLEFEVRSPRYFEYTATLPDGARWRFVDAQDTEPPFGGAKVLFDDLGQSLRLTVRFDAGRHAEDAVIHQVGRLAELVTAWGLG